MFKFSNDEESIYSLIEKAEKFIESHLEKLYSNYLANIKEKQTKIVHASVNSTKHRNQNYT